MDLHRDYETNVVDCLISCESVVRDLERELAARDDQIVSRDDRIASLEERVARLSLELASTRASEDDLRRRSETGGSADVRRGEEDGDEKRCLSEALAECGRISTYIPVSASGRGRRERSDRSGARTVPSIGGAGKEDLFSVTSSLTSSTSSVTNSVTTIYDIVGDRGQGSPSGEGNTLPLGALGARKLANLGRFLLNNLSRECVKEPEIAAAEKRGQRGRDMICGGCKRSGPVDGGRNKLEKSSASTEGLAFPISYIEII